mgnify:CR=1 FL=1
MWEAYTARRKFQYNGWVYCPPGQCTCSTAVGSELVTRIQTVNGSTSGAFDANPCENKDICNGQVATDCLCADGGYCGCAIKSWQYGGDLWLVREADPRKEYMLMRRFAIYDPLLPVGEELDKMIGASGDKKYTSLALGEPTVGRIMIDKNGNFVGGTTSKVIEPSINETLTLDEKTEKEKKVADMMESVQNR